MREASLNSTGLSHKLTRPTPQWGGFTASPNKSAQKHVSAAAAVKAGTQEWCNILDAEDTDVAEIYSPPRVTKSAEQWGLNRGRGLDLTTNDCDGTVWRSPSSMKRRRATDTINKDKPLLIVGSPMCTDRSFQ